MNQSIFRTGTAALLAFSLTASWAASPPAAPFDPEPYVASGSTNGDLFGAALACGDVDGDHTPDLAVGAPGTRVGGGGVYLFSGWSGAPLGQLRGGASDGRFGASLACADVDRDGVADIIVGAPHAPKDRFQSNGCVYVFSGKTRKQLFRHEAAEPGTRFGQAVAAGDVDGDGYADVIAGAPLASPTKRLEQAGSVFIYSGRGGYLLRQLNGPTPNLQTGVSLACADLNRDGRADVIAGAPGTSPHVVYLPGGVVAFSGRDGAVMYNLQAQTRSRIRGLGQSVGVGDVDGDGAPDILAGAPDSSAKGEPFSGAVQVFSGKTGAQVAEWFGMDRYSRMGSAVGAADVDGDGCAEVLAGAPDGSLEEERRAGERGPLGSVLVFSGKNRSLLTRVWGDPDGAMFGMAVTAPDVNDDQYPDLFAGAPCKGEAAGSLYCFFGDPQPEPDPGDRRIARGERRGWKVGRLEVAVRSSQLSNFQTLQPSNFSTCRPAVEPQPKRPRRYRQGLLVFSL